MDSEEKNKIELDDDSKELIRKCQKNDDHQRDEQNIINENS